MKLAVFFPGVGYHVDKPLLYFSRKIAEELGYETVTVPYEGFETGIRGKKEKMLEAFQSALRQTGGILKDIDFAMYEKIVFVSKSVGTAVASVYAAQNQIDAGHIYYTPVEASFDVMKQPGIVFHGTKDPWLDHEIFLKRITATSYAYELVENGNHSLETGNAMEDLTNLYKVMEKTREFLK